MSLPVILPGVAVRGDLDGLLVLSDRQHALGLGDFIVASIRAFVQRIGERVRTAANHRLAARKRIRRAFARHKAVAGHGDNRLRQRLAVVFLARRLGGQIDGALVDGQLAVDGIAEGVVLRHVCFAALDHVALNDVPAFVAHIRGAALDDRRQHVAVHQHARVGEIVIRQRRAVVDLFVVSSGDGNGLALALALGDAQFSLLLGDAVVVLIKLVGGRKGDGVRHFTLIHIGDAAGGAKVSYLAVDKAIAFHSDILAGQRRAIVFLAGRFGGQDYIALFDLQRARYQLDIVVYRLVFIRGGIGNGVCNLAFRNLGDRACALQGIDLAIDDVAIFDHDLLAGQRQAVIVLAAAAAGKDELARGDQHVGAALCRQAIQRCLEAHRISTLTGGGALYIGKLGAFRQVKLAGDLVVISNHRVRRFDCAIDVGLGNHAVAIAIISVLVVIGPYLQGFLGSGNFKVALVDADFIVGIDVIQLFRRLGDVQHIHVGADCVIPRIRAMHGQVNAAELLLHIGRRFDDYTSFIIEAESGIRKRRIRIAVYLAAVSNLDYKTLLFNAKGAVLHLKRNIGKVLVQVHAVVTEQVHVVHAHIGALGHSQQRCRLIQITIIFKICIHVIQRIIDCSGEALNGVLRAIVGKLLGIALDGNDDLALVLFNRQRAGLNFDGIVAGYIFIIAVNDGYSVLIDYQLVSVSARIDSHKGNIHIALRVAAYQAAVFSGSLHHIGSVGILAVRLAIVFLLVILRDDGYGALIHRQRTLYRFAEGVVAGYVLIAAHDPVALYLVVADADVRLATLDNCGQNVALHQRARVGEVVIRQRRAVVNLLAVSSGDGNGLALAPALGDGQLAFILGDGIVALFVVRAGGVGDGVGHFALMHEGHAAGSRDIGHLAVHKAVAGHGNIRLRQRRAVVFLARRLGGQRHGALVDGQLAINAVREGVVAGYVLIAARDHIARNFVHARVAHIRGAAFDNRRQHVAFHQHALGEGEVVIRQRGSVVGLVGAFRGDGDRFFRDRVDLQNAVHDLERYVREVLIGVLEIARSDAHGVFARVRALRSPRGGFGRLDALGHVVQLVVSRHGLVTLDAVLIAVVRHDVAVLRDGDDNLSGDRVDFQNAVHDIERDVREVLIRVLEIARSDAHGVFARVRALRSPRGGFGRLDALGHVVQLVVSRHGLVTLDAVLIAVVRHDVAVLRDGDGDLVGHRGDRHIAVDHCLDGHVVVGAGDGEGVLGQTHVRRANVRAPGDGEYIGLGADRNLTRLAGEAVVIAVHLVLLAVVHMRFIDARDGDGGRSLVDGQRAGFIGYIVIGRNCAAVVFDGAFINLVRGAARVGDGGGRRHGESEVLLRVAVDQTLHCEIGLGQRLTVVGLARILGLDGQGHSVIDRDDIFGFVSRDRDGLRGGIAGHIGGGIGEIERIALVRRQLFADGHGAGLVVGNLDGGAVQVMMDGVARGVELEVQLQHQRAVAGDNAGKHVVRVALIEHVLAAILRELIAVFNGNGRVRGAIITDNALVCLLRIRAVRVLIVELDGVLGVGVRRPDGVEDVFAVAVVHLHLRVGGDGAFALGVGVPALEGIADAGEGVGGLGGDGRVVGEVFNHVRAHAAVGLIGQGCASGTRAPLSGEGDDVLFIGVIALDLVLVAGLVGGRVVRPAEEVLAIISNQLARGLEVSKAVLRVGLAIHRSGYVVLAGNIFYSEGAVLGVVGEEGDVAVNLGVNVEGLAGAVRAGAPAAPGITGLVLHDRFLKGIQLISDRAAVRDISKRLTTITAINRNMCRSVDSRLRPMGVNGHVLRGHGLAGEDKLVSAFRRVIPTGKNVTFLASGRVGIGELVVARVRDALLVQVGGRLSLRAAVDVDNVIAITIIVEFGTRITAFVFRAVLHVAGEAGHLIPFFIRNGTAGITSIRVIQLISLAAYGFCTTFAGKNLYIIVSFTAATRLAVEILASNGHSIEV